ncbi:NIPSNAP family protein [Piscinibacter sp. XHJ-5]|uniref:NIPSNAP family protein n=1 Tax=Piscinibacter sp. XHJ-5 TaxID=3037797 RepID=UPI0024536949|nr:NIPSNAP family protein [Piscinibacter sp. XHJ-5]
MSNHSPGWPPVIELRQYTLHPGRRDALIALFEREFIEPQLALGMQLPGIFRDLDDPDRFVWLRGFADMPARARSLAAFYGGPVWQQHRDAANATMIDSDDVLLLRPALAFDAPAAAPVRSSGLVTATVCPLGSPADDALVQVWRHTMAPLWSDAGAELLSCLVTESAPNNFPRLPVREGEQVMAWFARFGSAEVERSHAAALARSTTWSAWCERLAAPAQRLRLAPTDRSALQA